MEETKLISTEFEQSILELVKSGIEKVVNSHLETKRLLNDAEAAEILDVAEGTLAVWRVNGKGPAYVKIGSNVRYQRPDLEAYIEKRKRRP